MHTQKMLALLLMIQAAGCATLLVPSTAHIPVTSNPPGATVLLDGQRLGETPMVVQAANKNRHVITLHMDGYREGVCQLTTGVGAGYVILDVLLGIVPAIIDVATNSWTDIDQRDCRVTLQPGTTAAAAPTTR
jgi:hypothetical protein